MSTSAGEFEDEVWPGGVAWLGDMVFELLNGYEMQELSCEDFADQLFSWVLYRELPVPG